MIDKKAAGDYVPDYFGTREYQFTAEEIKQADEILRQMLHGTGLLPEKPGTLYSIFYPYQHPDMDLW